MPATSKYTFVIEIDGSQAGADAQRWAKEIEQHLRGIKLDVPGFEIAGLSQAAAAAAGTQNLPAQAEVAAAQTQNAFQRMVSGVLSALQKLRAGQKGTFDPTVKEAEEAYQEVVGGSWIPDMVRDVLHWLGILKENEDDLFVPLIKGAQYSAAEVNKAFQTMRYPAGAVVGGKAVGGQFTTKEQLQKFFSVVGLPPTQGPGSVAGYIDEQERFFKQEIEQYQQGLKKADQVAEEQKRLFQRLGVTEAEWARKGGLDKFGTAIQAAQMQAWGLRGFGTQITSLGRSMQMAATAAAGSATLAAREYLQLNDPLERAARNMELNRTLTDELDASLRQMAGTVSTLQATEMADILYKWAAATGAQVDSSDELNATLKATADLQKLVKIGYVGAEQAVEIVTDVQSQYGKSVDDTSDIVAKLLTVAARSKAEVADLGSAFSMVGSRADMANVSFEETAATLNILAAYGQRGSRAGTGLGMMMENLVAPSEKAQKLIDEALGAGALESAEGKFIGIAAAVELIAEKTKDWTDFERQAFLAQITTANATRMISPLIDMQIRARERGINAIRAEQKILDGVHDAEVAAYVRMREEVDGYTISTQSAVDTASGMWQQYLDGLTGRADMVKARWASMVDTIGKQVTTVVLPELEKLMRVVSELLDSAGERPDLVRAALGGTAVVAGVGALVTAFGKGITLYADIRMIGAASTMLAAAKEQVAAAGTMLEAAGIQAGGAGAGAGAGAGGGLARGAAGALGALSIAAGTVYVGGLVADALADAVGPLLYGKDIWAKEAKQPWMERAAARVGLLNPGQAGSALGALAGVKLFGEGADQEVLATIVQQAGELLGIQTKITQETGETLSTTTEITDEARRWVFTGYEIGRYTSEIADETRRWSLMGAEAKAQIMDAYRAEALAAQAAKEVTANSTSIITVWNTINSKMAQGADILLGMAGMAKNLQQGVMHIIPTMQELNDQLTGELSGGWDQFVGLTGLMDPATIGAWGDMYVKQLTALYMSMRGKEQWEIDLAVQAFKDSWDKRVEKVRGSADAIAKAQEELRQKAEQTWSDWESFVGGLLQPTEVTQEDVALSGVGAYEDKWDEYVRRLRAAQTDMQSVFRKMLPTDVEQAGQESINTWVERQVKAFYAGMMPDQVNWDALIAEYDRMVEEKLGRNQLLDIFMQKLIESGRTPDEYAAKKALGLESPIKQLWFGGVSAEQIGLELQADMGIVASKVKFTPDMAAPAATSFASALGQGVRTSLGDQTWASAVIQSFDHDVTARVADVKGLGARIGGFIFDGMREELRRYSIIDVIVADVIEELAGGEAE